MPILPPAIRGSPNQQTTRMHNVESILAENWFYEVPKFQRWYSWGSTQVEDFLQDISSSIRMQEMHSFGSIEATNSGETHEWDYNRNNIDVSYPVFLISDGQQRITTMFIFWFAVCHFERAEGRYDMYADLERKFFRRNARGAIVAPFLKLQEDELDNGLKQLAENGNINAIPLVQQTSAVHKMRDTFIQISTFIGNLSDLERDAYYTQIMSRTEIVLVFGFADPHVKFEVRNNRGIDVSELDRTKNMIQLIGKRTGHGRFEFSNDWYESLKQLDLNRLSGNDDELLGHTMTMFDGTHFGIGKYSTFREYFLELATSYNAADPDHAAKIDDLERWVQCFNNMTVAYCNVFSPSRNENWKIYGEFSKYIGHANWNTSKRGHLIALLSDICIRLNRENVFDSDILAMYHSLEDPDDFIRCLKQLEKVVFRVYLVGSRKTTFGKRFRATFAKEIYDWNGTQADLVTKILNDLCQFCTHTEPHAECTLDSLFDGINLDAPVYRKSWSLYFVYHWQVRKYKQLLLGSITKKWQSEHKAPDEDGLGNSLFEKEHIMPQTGWMNWKDEYDGQFYWTRGVNPHFSVKNDFERTKHFLGNLVMAKHVHNAAYSNHPFNRQPADPDQEAKRTLYLALRDWSEVRSVARNYKEWNGNTIRDRQERMARWAIKRWKLECDNDALEEELKPMRFINEHTEDFVAERLAGAQFEPDVGDFAHCQIHDGDDEEGGQATPTISEELEGYDFPEDFYTDEEE